MYRGICLWVMVIVILGLVGDFAFGSTGHLYYYDGPWRGTVIDTETKQPVEGAVVVAIWRKEYGGPAGPYSYFLDAKEVLTDKEGRFLIPKFWKLNLIPILSWIQGPEFEIFKPGFTAFPGVGLSYFKYFPKTPLGMSLPSLSDLFKKGVVVELLKLKTREERLHNTPALPTGVNGRKLPLYDSLIKEEDRNLGIGR
jgi:hypothetical protein